MATAAHLAMPGTACNHWLQQIDPLSTVHRRVRHVPRRRGAAVDQLESPRRPSCPRGFQQPAQHGCTAQERREPTNRPPDHHSPSALCASTAAEIVPRTCSSRGPSARHAISYTRRDPWGVRMARSSRGEASSASTRYILVEKRVFSAFLTALPLTLAAVQTATRRKVDGSGRSRQVDRRSPPVMTAPAGWGSLRARAR